MCVPAARATWCRRRGRRTRGETDRARRAASDSTAAQVESSWLFEKDVLHTAGVLLLPVAVVALVLLYCASGKDRWKKKLSAEERPLVRPTPAAPGARR